MGRPRKRRQVEEAESTQQEASQSLASKSPSPPVLAASEPVWDASRSPATDREKSESWQQHSSTANWADQNTSDPFPTASAQSWSFGDYGAPPIPIDSTLDLFGAVSNDDLDFMNVIPNYTSATPAAPHGLGSATEFQEHGHATPHVTSLQDAFGDAFDGTDLMASTRSGQAPANNHHHNSNVPRRAPASNVLHKSFNSWVTSSSTPPPAPSTSSPSASTRSQQPPVRPNPSVSCGCLSSLYLSLDSLNNLPSDIFAAIRTARHAAKVARYSVSCPVCSCPARIEDPNVPVPVQAHQNMMLLAALVPAACNAYAAILQRVEGEVAGAQRRGEELFFSFDEVGGHWRQSADEHGQCVLVRTYNNQKVPPDMWRSLMRDIIRIDINGSDDDDDENHPSLRGVLRATEERSNRRHAVMDAAQAAGQLKEQGFIFHPPGQQPPTKPEDRHCMRIMDHARFALDRLTLSD